jgi:integrase
MTARTGNSGGDRPKRGQREGSVREVGPDRWRGEIMLAGQRRSVSGPTRADVLRQLDDLRARHRAGLLPLPAAERQTVGEYLRQWLEGRRAEGLSAKHWRNHEAYVALHLTPALGRLRLTRLTAGHLRALYGRLLRPPGGTGRLGPRSVRGVHTTIRQALDQAVDDGLLPLNVARKVRPPRLPRKAAPKALQTADLRRFWLEAERDRLYALWLLAACIGCRQGEVRALLWSDADWRGGTLTIARNLPASVQRLEEAKLPKTAAGARTVRLSPRLLEALRAHGTRQAEERRRAGPAYVDQGLIFCTRYGTVLRGENLLRRFKQLLANAGVGGRYVFHDLRHTAASGMLAAGVPVSEVAELLGHASSNVTTTIYAHAIRRSGRSAVEQLEAFYDRETGATEREPQ